jgi:hypothetical protein
MEEHKDSQFCRRFVSVSDPADREYGVAVYDTDPSAPFDYFTLRFSEGRFELVSRATQAPAITWRVPRAYVERIVDDPEGFIEDPAGLLGVDAEWLKSRLDIAP